MRRLCVRPRRWLTRPRRLYYRLLSSRRGSPMSRPSVHMTPTTPRRRPLRRLRFHRSEGRWWRRFLRLAGFRGARTVRPRGMRHALEPKALCPTRCRPHSGSRTALRPAVHNRTLNPSPISNGGSSETSCLRRSSVSHLRERGRWCAWWALREWPSAPLASGLGFNRRPASKVLRDASRAARDWERARPCAPSRDARKTRGFPGR